MENIPAFQHLGRSRNSSAIRYLENQLYLSLCGGFLLPNSVPTEQPRQPRSPTILQVSPSISRGEVHTLPPPSPGSRACHLFLPADNIWEAFYAQVKKLSLSAGLVLAELDETSSTEFSTPALCAPPRAIVSGCLQTPACTSLQLHSSCRVFPCNYSW